MTPIFIYYKNGKIKALDLERAKKEMPAKDWSHVSTLDACKLIEYLYNQCSDIEKIEEIKNLIK